MKTTELEEATLKVAKMIATQVYDAYIKGNKKPWYDAKIEQAINVLHVLYDGNRALISRDIKEHSMNFLKEMQRKNRE